jgi:hypothetical protein
MPGKMTTQLQADDARARLQEVRDEIEELRKSLGYPPGRDPQAVTLLEESINWFAEVAEERDRLKGFLDFKGPVTAEKIADFRRQWAVVKI